MTNRPWLKGPRRGSLSLDIIAMHIGGLRNVEIAEQIGCSTANVTLCLKRHADNEALRIKGLVNAEVSIWLSNRARVSGRKLEAEIAAIVQRAYEAEHAGE